MSEPILPPLKPIPIKDRVSVIFLEKGNLDVLDGAFVVVDKNGTRTHIPVGGVACLMLEPGTRVSHAAVTLASRVGCLLVWVGEAGVRLYASGQPGGARADRPLYQAKLALDDEARLKIVRKMYAMRFKEAPPERRSIEQLRGIEGVRVRKLYELIGKQYGVTWKSRNYDYDEWGSGDTANRCLSSATACLYGICEAAMNRSRVRARRQQLHVPRTRGDEPTHICLCWWTRGCSPHARGACTMSPVLIVIGWMFPARAGRVD